MLCISDALPPIYYNKLDIKIQISGFDAYSYCFRSFTFNI